MSLIESFVFKGKFSEYQLTRKETLPTFRLDALVFFRAKVKLDANTCYLLAAHIKTTPDLPGHPVTCFDGFLMCAANK